MRKHKLLLPAIFGCIVLLANLDGALPENTAAPGDLTCGRAPCHNIPVNVGDSQISIVFDHDDSTYLPDSSYDVTVRIQNPMTQRNGFQLLALNASNLNTGVWTLPEPDKTKVIPGISFPNRRYVTHRAAGNQQNEWTVRWKAPAVAAGNITFYASVLSANNNGMNTGDEVYTTKVSALPGMVSGIAETPETAFKVYPVPATTGVWVEGPLEYGTITLLDAGGIPAKAVEAISGEKQFIGTESLPPGLYFLHITGRTRSVLKKVVLR